jgi:hypothetical protein
MSGGAHSRFSRSRLATPAVEVSLQGRNLRKPAPSFNVPSLILDLVCRWEMVDDDDDQESRQAACYLDHLR